MNPFRSVGARLSVALAAVVLAALALVYAILVPSLEQRSADAKVRQLRRVAPVVARQYDPFDPDYVTSAAATASARVVVYHELSLSPPTLQEVADSQEGRNAPDISQDPFALRAFDLRTHSGTIERRDEKYAEVAFAVSPDTVVLLSASLHDALASVHLVQGRLLAAAGIALLASLLVGFGAAAAFARRIRRLERSADRIASGDFTQPVVDEGSDELGELAVAFERMRRRLAQLDDARRAFIANASHELRTPIFSLGGFLELLRDEELDEATRREFLGTMAEQVERLTKLATDLLDLSRLDAGRLRLEREPVDLGGVAQKLREEFRAVALAGDHALEAVVEEEALGLGDPERALQIGRALVENALVHTPPGTPVRVVAARGRGGSAELAVEDEGQGIPPEHAEHVFERFRRLDGTRASGSGLGLAIARELAEAMGGSLRLASADGVTRFTLVLPVAERAEEREPVPA